MRRFQDTSIKFKQTVIVMGTTLVALLLVCLAFIVTERITLRASMVNNLTTLAEMMADNTSAAVELSALDPSYSNEVVKALQLLSSDQSILRAWVYDVEDQFLAGYKKRPLKAGFEAPARKAEGWKFIDNRLWLSQPIVSGGDGVGTLYVESDLGELTHLMNQTVLIVLVVLLASGVLAFGISNRLQRLITEPVLQLVGAARMVAEEKNYAVRAAKSSDDELGLLVDGFNEMLTEIQQRDDALSLARADLERRVHERTQELEEIHAQLIVASREAGMAEVATSVLHNVGNVLNSVNVSTSIISDRIHRSKASNVAKAALLIEEHSGNLGAFFAEDPKGRTLPGYLQGLAHHLEQDRALILGELKSLADGVNHIKEIISMQQSFSGGSGLTEKLSAEGLMEDALRLNLAALERHRITVTREFEPLPLITLDKHRTLQILLNLLQNAKHALCQSGREDRRILLRIEMDQAGWALFSVIDNGIGITPENLTRIFSHGFTTRRDGHGFGLHSGALAAREMGGELMVESAGEGKGASFTLKLPCELVDGN